MHPFWSGKKVFVTGHTGFKGAWLTLLLHHWGAKVYGYALPAEELSLYRTLDLSRLLAGEKLADIGDKTALGDFYRSSAPDVTIHMAAQALVLDSYEDPVETFRVNVVGTSTLLDVVRLVGRKQTVIVVTSDKVYENHETGRSYIETDALGGADPYSVSKACTELVSVSFRRSFCSIPEKGMVIKTARAGNVIGAGDWSINRLVPDAMRAVLNKQELIIRHPESVRPWQHVLEPLSGYILLAETVMQNPTHMHDSFNFGPDRASCWAASKIVDRLVELTQERLTWRNLGNDTGAPHEATLLHLDSSRAYQALGWRPRWDIDKALMATVAGYEALQTLSPELAQAELINQIDDYFQKS